ncbi:efflux RND transporter periplasmic adaptor subunit [Pseudomonadales bacterium]|jgi:RND family efflux transporter MFP subunit|nr:efflux RND transporter periplasmic adaptor subunit [Pseudomonadales bacterium]MDB2509839.1 efflux RND transporter periplasmic adaptor subunit [Pseudomonadales bacterium]
MPNTAIKAIITIAVLLAAVAAAAGIIMSRPMPEQLTVSETTSAIRAMTVVKESLRLKIRSEGTVTPKTQTNVIPEIKGRVTWISPNLVVGGYFQAGDLLVTIDAADYEARTGLAQAQLLRAEAELEHKRFELQRLQTLIKDNLVSQSNLENAARAHKIAKANVIESKINLAQAERDLSRTKITAPFEGMVRSESIDIGQFVQQGTPIASIYASDAVEVRLPIVNAQLAYLDPANLQRGELDPATAPMIRLTARYAGTSFVWRGQLARTEGEIDAQSRMITAVARVRQDNQSPDVPPLQVGAFVAAEIEGQYLDDIVRLPRAALRPNSQVLIIDGDNRLRFRAVNVLRLENDFVLIDSGLESGEVVNLSPIQTVVDGMRVSLTFEPTADRG